MKLFHDLDFQGAFRLVRAVLGGEAASAAGELRYDATAKRAEAHDGTAARRLLQDNDLKPASLLDLSDVSDTGAQGDALLKGASGYAFGPQLLRAASVSVGNAAFVSLNSSPFTVAAAPGSGKIAIPLAAWAYFAPGSPASHANAPDIELAYANSAAGQGARLLLGTDYASAPAEGLSAKLAEPLFAGAFFTGASLPTNQALVLRAVGSDPVGTGACKAFVWYALAETGLAI